MRTTVEILPEHRSSLLELAARRGEKGFSSVLAEALEAYFAAERNRDELRREFASLAGCLEAEDAEELRAETHTLRASWR